MINHRLQVGIRESGMWWAKNVASLVIAPLADVPCWGNPMGRNEGWGSSPTDRSVLGVEVAAVTQVDLWKATICCLKVNSVVSTSKSSAHRVLVIELAPHAFLVSEAHRDIVRQIFHAH